MKNILKLSLILALSISASVLIVVTFLVYFLCQRSLMSTSEVEKVESIEEKHHEEADRDVHIQVEDLVTFQDGDDLTISDILEAPGEVIGKSNYGTLYKALLQTTSDSVKLLRFLRPACTTRADC